MRDADNDLGLIGLEDEELARLLAQQDAAEGPTDGDAVPKLQETPISVLGDLWLLGEHRLLCGDATVRADVERLIAGEAIDLIFTDLSYNVDYEGYTEDRLKIRGDRMTAEQFQQFLREAFGSYRRIAKPGASMYACHTSSWQREFQNAMESAGFEADRIPRTVANHELPGSHERGLVKPRRSASVCEVVRVAEPVFFRPDSNGRFCCQDRLHAPSRVTEPVLSGAAKLATQGGF